MKYKKSILLMFFIFLFTISAVNAIDVNDKLMSSENADQTILYLNDEINDDNLQISEENNTLTQTNEILGADESTYSELAREIGSGGNKILSHDYYTYDSGSTININIENSVIDGNGAVIDMAGSTNMRALYVSASSVTIKNIIFKNAKFNGNGGAVYFSGTGTVTNCNFTNNNATRNGGAVYFSGTGTVTNCNFTNNSLNAYYSYGGAIYFNRYGSVENCNFTGNKATADGGAIWMYFGSVENCNFTNNKVTGDSSYGGAIYFSSSGTTHEVRNCNFTNNIARYGGAVYFSSNGDVSNCNFTDNEAYYGGAIWFTTNGKVTNSNFAGNNANFGSTIYFNGYVDGKTVSNSIFLNNRANSEALDVSKNDNNITLIFTGNDNLLNAIYSVTDVSFTNVTYWGVNVIANTDSSTPSRSNKEAGQNITVNVVVNDKLVLNNVITTDENGMIVLDISAGENYYISARHDTDSYYTEAEKTISNNTKFNVNVTSQTTHNKTVNITAKSNIFSEFMQGKLLFILPKGKNITANYAGNGTWWAEHTFDDYGVYQVNASYGGLDNVTVNNGTISISKTPTEIKVENTSVNLFVLDSVGSGAFLTPAEAGNLTFTSSNSSVAKVEEGKIIAIGEGKAVITVSFAGDDMYAAADNKTISVTVTLNDASVSVNNYTLDLFVDDTFTIVPTTNPDGLTVTFVPDDSGVYRIDENGVVTALKEGKGSILLKVVGDGVYAENSTIVNVTVSKFSTEISVNSTSLKLLVDDETVIVAILTPADAGNVTFTSSNDSIVSVDAQGNVIAWSKGQAIITVSFMGDNKYAAAENKTITVDVGLNDASVTVDNDTLDLEVGETYAINATKHPKTILLDIDYNSSDDSVATVDENGIVTAVGEGTAIITVEVGDDERYAKNSTTVKVTVSKVPTEINIDSATLDLEVKDEIATGATLTPADAGNLTYTVSNSSVVKVENGKIVAYAEGTSTITVSYNGDDKYAASENKTITVTVSLRNASVSVNNNTLDLLIGDEFIVVVATNPEGLDVTFTPDNSGVVSVDENGVVTALKEGKASINVSVGGDGVYVLNNSYVTVSVNKIPTEISVVSSVIGLEVLDEVDAGAILTPADAGNLTYSVSNYSVVKVENGRIVALGEGSSIVMVSFAGNDKYEAAENKTITVTVSLRNASVSVNNNTLDLLIGDEFIVVVTTNPEGLDVTFTSDNSGVVSVDENGVINALKEGKATIKVSVGGEGVYALNSTDVIVTVSKIPTSISADVGSELAVGDNTNVNYTLTPSDATGKVTFKSNNTKVLTVDAEGNVKAVGEGFATITLTYAGDDKYALSNTTVSVKVSKSEIKPEIQQNDTTLTVSVPEDATGDVTVSIGNKTITAPIKDGKAVIDLSDVPAGDYNATVSYPGDGKYSGFEVVSPVSIEPEFQLIAENLTKYYHGPERFAVKAIDGKRNPISGAEVKISLNGMTYTRITDENGSASIGINLESGVFITTVSCNNTTVEATITVLTTVNGTDLVKVFRNATQYYATFRDSEGNYLKEGTTVRFNIHGVFYDLQISGDKGLAKLNINLEHGEYIITSINLETGESRANNITVLPRIVENYDLTKYYRNESQYTVKLIGDDGNPVGAGEEVTFNINGVFYTRTTNESGIAKLNINLQPGDYIITAGYKECMVSNKIKVLPVLTAKDLTKKYGTKDQFVANLVDGQGKPYAGQSIQFNINGVFYNRVTDSNGQAKLNINLQPGEYIITSSYNGASIGNKVTVTA